MLHWLILLALGVLAALLGALVGVRRLVRWTRMDAMAVAAAAIAEARQQGYADGLTEGYRRGRHDLRGAVERARMHGYDEALADAELGEEGGE